MTGRECKLFGLLFRYQKDRKIIYRRVAHSTTEQVFKDELLWSHDVSVRHINESGKAFASDLATKPTLIGRLWLFVMDVMMQVGRLTGIRDRNLTIVFCLVMDSIVIRKYEKALRTGLSDQAMNILTKQVEALKNARERTRDLRAHRQKGQPFAPHFKLI